MQHPKAGQNTQHYLVYNRAGVADRPELFVYNYKLVFEVKMWFDYVQHDIQVWNLFVVHLIWYWSFRMTFANEKLEYDPAAGNTILDYQVSSTIEYCGKDNF